MALRARTRAGLWTGFVLAGGLGAAPALASEDTHPAPAPSAHSAHTDGEHASHFHGRHGNPADMEAYIARQEEASRAAWQKPEAVIEALQLAPGQTVCDIGSGPGYFSLRLARVLGESGRVYAVDVEARMVEALRDRLERSGLRNVLPVLALGSDPLLPDGVCDLVLIVDTYHHFEDGPAYLRRLGRALRPGGRLANIDFHPQAPIGPPPAHRVARERFLDQAAGAGFRLVREQQFLPHQYFVVLEKRP